MHRYPDRVLFKLVHVCAVYCRFCFRREMVGPGKATALSHAAYRGALDYIRAHSEIWEVILTGGDPLMLSPRRLAEIMADLAAIDHVRIIRIHTRVPVADPARISGEMIAALEGRGRDDLGCPARQSCPGTDRQRRAPPAPALIDAGIPMVSQSVLLRGVNDDAATLEALMRAFVECRIKPYYLHHGDLAPGTAHLRTTLAQGQELMRALAGAGVRIVPAGLCARYSRRPWQGAGRPELPVAGRFFLTGTVNQVRNCAIVLSIIAATFISIRRSHDRPIADGADVEAAAAAVGRFSVGGEFRCED